jgi:hypothetical protein
MRHCGLLTIPGKALYIIYSVVQNAVSVHSRNVRGILKNSYDFQGRVRFYAINQFPTGGNSPLICPQGITEPVEFRRRRYSPDGRKSRGFANGFSVCGSTLPVKNIPENKNASKSRCFFGGIRQPLFFVSGGFL